MRLFTLWQNQKSAIEKVEKRPKMGRPKVSVRNSPYFTLYGFFSCSAKHRRTSSDASADGDGSQVCVENDASRNDAENESDDDESPSGKILFFCLFLILSPDDGRNDASRNDAPGNAARSAASHASNVSRLALRD